MKTCFKFVLLTVLFSSSAWAKASFVGYCTQTDGAPLYMFSDVSADDLARATKFYVSTQRDRLSADHSVLTRFVPSFRSANGEYQSEKFLLKIKHPWLNPDEYMGILHDKDSGLEYDCFLTPAHDCC